ncbi:RecX family regulatory protein [Bordetella ansorpii]|uniref:Regulatory protein RecX n=1 Tax=Bordetella ansorpii TaxID=288768 RepID=A0A157SQ31_9BORD|nr:recombination regulator RecX [Bordetella ansorpii]SAI71996.1 RecX family regulatory protein [Bordetella ansorpii]
MTRPPGSRRGPDPADLDDEFETVTPRSGAAGNCQPGDGDVPETFGGEIITRTSSRYAASRKRSSSRSSPDDPVAEDAAENGASGKPAQRGLSLKARAVNYLSRREHARGELARKLAPHAESPEQIEALLDDLQREGWLSDERFAQSLVHRRAPQRGTARVVQELKQYGLDADKVAELRDQMRATEYERALEAWRKRFGQKPADRAAYAKQARFLTSRGFAHDVIRRILGEGDDES